MAVVQISKAPSREAYEGINKGLEADGGPVKPAGLIVHTASELPSGEVFIADVWETPEALASFTERIGKVFEAQGLAEMVAAGPAPEVYTPFNVI